MVSYNTSRCTTPKKPVAPSSPPLATRSPLFRPQIGTPPSSPRNPSPKATRRQSDRLKELWLATFCEHYPSLANQTVRESLSHSQSLAERVSRGCQTWNHSPIQWLTRNARLLPGRTWEQLPWSGGPLQVARQLKSLPDASFLDRRENVLVFENPGSGKTDLPSVLADPPVPQDRTVLFTRCSFWVLTLLAAKREPKLSCVIKRRAGFEALIVDDLAYVQQSRQEMKVLFTRLAERYQRGSVLRTGDLPFSQRERLS